VSEPEPRWPAEGKAGRNKGRELVAGAVNNVAVALLLAATLQPVLATVQQQRTLRYEELVTSIMFLFGSIVCFFIAQAVIRRVED
jgi:hypothetical protein